MDLLEKVVSKENMHAAYKAVWRNQGSSGIDGMELDKLLFYLTRNWESIKEAVLKGKYYPQAVLGVEIDKETGGKRLLGIPTVVDRLIQQAIHQELSRIWDKDFSNWSYGFRPGRSAEMAILQAKSYINEGYANIVDIDLKQFFDKVNHDFLMNLIKRKVQNPKLLRLIWRYLRSPIQIKDKLHKRRQGVPQGGPLSPILSNILLDELDKELERRSVRFVRYADDFSIFMRSRRAANRIKGSISKFIRIKLHLEVNHAKSKVCRPLNYEYLGYAFVSSYEKGVKGKYQLVVSKSKLEKLKRELKSITRKTIPASFTERIERLNQLMRGWVNYFKHASMQEKLASIDSWVRNRLRYCIWHHWKKPDKKMRSLIRLGIEPGEAYAFSRTRLGGWRVACSPILGTTITLNRLKQRGYVSFEEYYNKIRNPKR
jgi:group II intron reverse transcriptase/maturase